MKRVKVRLLNIVSNNFEEPKDNDLYSAKYEKLRNI